MKNWDGVQSRFKIDGSKNGVFDKVISIIVLLFMNDFEANRMLGILFVAVDD